MILSLMWPKLLEKVLQRELQVEKIYKRARREHLKVAMKLQRELGGRGFSLVH